MECAFKRATKLGLDFVATSRCGYRMDDDTHELITLLTSKAGMLMEDKSVIALSCGRQDAVGIASVLDELERSVARMGALIGAAKAIVG